MGIQVGLFHGGKSLCQPLKAETKDIKEQVNFNKILTFDIDVCNIPRNAKLCFVVYEVHRLQRGSKSRKTKDMPNYNYLAWANTTVYDFKNQLRTGSMTLYFWTSAEDIMSEDAFHPLGTVVQNPNVQFSISLTLDFTSYIDDSQQFFYTPIDCISNYEKIEIMSPPQPSDIEASKKILEENDNFMDVHEQERKNIWYLREYWRYKTHNLL